MTDQEILMTALKKMQVEYSDDLVVFVEDRVVELNLSGRIVERTLPEELFELTALTRLDLSGNALKSIPESIFNLGQLRYLMLQENELTEFPTGIYELDTLREVNISENFLKSVPPGIQDMHSLTSLNLSVNRIESVTTGISELQNLEILYLGNNLLTEFPVDISKMQRISSINLSQNLLNSMSITLEPGHPIQVIDVSNNQLLEFEIVTTDFSSLQIRSIDISDNRLSKIQENLLSLPYLNSFSFYNNPIQTPPKELVGYLRKSERPDFNLYITFADYFVLNQDFASLINLWESIDFEKFGPHERAEIYNVLGYSYSEIGEMDKAFVYYEKGVEVYRKLTQNLDINDPMSVEMFLGLGKLYASIGDTYRKKRKFKDALMNLNEAQNILEKISEQIGEVSDIAMLYYEIAKYYYDKKDRETAVEYLLKSATLFPRTAFPEEIDKVLDKLYTLNPEQAFRAASYGPFNQYWLVRRVSEMMKTFQPIPGKYWGVLHRSIADFWTEVKNKLLKREYKESTYYKNWKLRFLTEKAIARTTNFSLFNFIAGANNIESDKEHDYKHLRSEQHEVPPLWFLEFPVLLHHDERYMKIRVNNMISSYQDGNLNYMTFPTNTTKPNLPVKRVKIKIDMPWQQSYEFDHIFEPNSESEYEASQKNPLNTWLTDVYSIDIGNHPQAEDNITINYIVKLYFEDERKEDADVVTTSKTYTLPVVRKNRFQVIQKYKNQHSNALAVILVAWSILSTALGYVGQATEFIQKNAGTYDPSQLVIAFIGGLITLALLTAFFIFQRINKEILEDKVYLVKEQL